MRRSPCYIIASEAVVAILLSLQAKESLLYYRKRSSCCNIIITPSEGVFVVLSQTQQSWQYYYHSNRNSCNIIIASEAVVVILLSLRAKESLLYYRKRSSCRSILQPKQLLQCYHKQWLQYRYYNQGNYRSNIASEAVVIVLSQTQQLL